MVRVFFYGLFMDQAILMRKGIEASDPVIGSVPGYELRIGERATLIRKPDVDTFGVVMTIAPQDLVALYSDDSVSDYVPELVSVILQDGRVEEATCYNLPLKKLSGTNREYAERLHDLAIRLEFPDEHVAHIRSFI